MKRLTISIAFFYITQTISAQNVGIGVPSPIYRLDVAGSIRASSNFYVVGGNVGIGTTSPAFRLQVSDGSLAVYSTNDDKYWSFG